MTFGDPIKKPILVTAHTRATGKLQRHQQTVTQVTDQTDEFWDALEDQWVVGIVEGANSIQHSPYSGQFRRPSLTCRQS